MTGASGGGPDVPAADPAIRWSVGSQEHTDQGSENGRLGGGRAERRLGGRYSVGGLGGEMVETRRLELLTLSLQRRCSAS